MGRYVVRVWVPVEMEDEEIYSSYEDARSVMESLSMMQPENVHLVIDLDAEEEENGDNEVAR